MIDRSFFQRDPLTCARELIGCELVWNDCAGIIVETEAYFALGDEACHTFARPSARAFVEKHDAGAAYVYFNYGMYWLLNVLVKGGSADGFVLFRAIEPVRGIEMMTQRRVSNLKSEIKNLKSTALCSGPGKLTIALGVDGADHGRDFCTGKGVTKNSFRSPMPEFVTARKAYSPRKRRTIGFPSPRYANASSPISASQLTASGSSTR